MRGLPIGFLFISLFVLCYACSDLSDIPLAELSEKVNDLEGACLNWRTTEEPLLTINGIKPRPQIKKRMKVIYIDSISVLKCKQAMKKYGELGKRGAIEIYADEKIFTDLDPIDK